MVEASIDSSDEDIFQNYAGKNGIKPYRFEPKRRRLNVDQHGNKHKSKMDFVGVEVINLRHILMKELLRVANTLLIHEITRDWRVVFAYHEKWGKSMSGDDKDERVTSDPAE
ncbi:hypothetical protein GQR58_014875 [Nymphon striatum]|nr:hypothetical protein GQR58_014875 [Nymphon striatum]